ncbi:hypothetical protein ABPG72_018840 [Tetrahymena utriculariae]
MSQENINQENDLNNEFSSSESYLATFEAAIQQLQKIIENPDSKQKTTLSQNQQQLLILQEKYEKIEHLVYVEQEQIEQLIGAHIDLQKELNGEYTQHQNIIAQGKREILQLTLANKHALQIQNDGQRTLEQNRQEAEKIVQYIQKLQKDIQSLNVIMQDKEKEEKIIDDENNKLQSSIDEFRKDQSEQKDGMEDKKHKLISLEKQIKQVRNEQFDMQKKQEVMKRSVLQIKQRIAQYQSDQEVALSELKNEKRTLQVSEKKLDEINRGLEKIQSEIKQSDQHLEQIRDLNKSMKNKVEQVQNAVMIYQSEGPDSEELRNLESLLGQYNELLEEKQKVFQSKEQEKNLLQEHLQQMSNFAQQYLEKQNQGNSQNDNQVSNLTSKLEATSEAALNNQDNQVINSNNVNNSQTFGMECIQSQYEQEQESSLNTQNANIHTYHQSKQSASSSNYQIYLDQGMQKINTSVYNQEDGIQEEKQTTQNKSLNQNQQNIQEKHISVENQQINNNSQLQQQNLQQQNKIFQQISVKDSTENAILEINKDSSQKQSSQSCNENNQVINEQLIGNKVFNQSFGNTLSPSLQESPVQVERYQNNSNHLDSDQKQIQQEFDSGAISIDQQKLEQFIEIQERQERKEKQKSEAYEEAHSNKNSSQKALSETNQKLMIKMGVPGFGGYKDILNQLKSGFLQNQQQE